MKIITRRSFLKGLGGGLAGLACLRLPGCARASSGKTGSSLRLVFFTDVHAHEGENISEPLELAARAVNAAKPDMVIAGGDLITKGFTSSPKAAAPRWEAYLRLHNAIKAQVYPVLGNHDLVAAKPKDGSAATANPRAEFLERMGLERTYYSFDAAGYHFVMLDSVFITPGGRNYEGRISDNQLDWLKKDLASMTPGTPVVATSHIPLLMPEIALLAYGATPPPKNHVVQNRRTVLQLLARYNFVLLLQGHLHFLDYSTLGKAAVITGGAVCGAWWQGAWMGTPEGFSLITSDGRGMELEYLGYGWSAEAPLR